MELLTLDGGDPDLLLVLLKLALFLSSLGDLLLSRLFPFLFLVVSLEFGLTLVAVFDLLGFNEVLLDILLLLVPSMAKRTFWDPLLPVVRLVLPKSLTGGALAIVGLKSGSETGGTVCGFKSDKGDLFLDVVAATDLIIFPPMGDNPLPLKIEFSSMAKK